MAKSDEYMEEAYDALKKLSADDRAKLEYEAREKAIRDYNSQMSSALRRGRKKRNGGRTQAGHWKRSAFKSNRAYSEKMPEGQIA